MLDPTLLGALTATLEKTINAALRYDPGTRVALGKLAGRVLAIESTFPPVTLYLQPQNEESGTSLSIHAYCETPVETTLRGALPAILALTFGSQHSLANTGVEVTGNPGLLAALQDVFANIDIDWEEPVNDVLGSALGHPFAQMLRKQWQWGHSNIDKAQKFMGDYITEELRATPSRSELEHFYQSVSQTRSDTERLAQRIRRLTEVRNRQGD